jgi:hypothetical protein
MNKTPVSLTEDIYSTDLTPWWRYLLVRLNPWRLVRRRPEMCWVPFTVQVFQLQTHVAVLFENRSVLIFSPSESQHYSHCFASATHYCQLPELP